jgi:membrane-associated phospholipid phosphatase
LRAHLSRILIAALLWSTPSLAQEGNAPVLFDLKMQPSVDLAVTASGAAALLAFEAFGKKALPLSCNWCERDVSGKDLLNGFDRFGRGAAWPVADQNTASKISDDLVNAAIPLSMVGLEALVAHQDGALSQTPNDLLIIAESAVLAGLVNLTAKSTFRRERPYVYLRDAGGSHLTASVDDNFSFYSGHTSMAFSLATAAGTVATLRGYHNAWMVWAVGIPLATATGYLRMAADRHYLSDVLVGAGMGSAFGVGVPLLLHGRVGRLQLGSVEMRVTPSANGVGFAGRF